MLLRKACQACLHNKFPKAVGVQKEHQPSSAGRRARGRGITEPSAVRQWCPQCESARRKIHARKMCGVPTSASARVSTHYIQQSITYVYDAILCGLSVLGQARRAAVRLPRLSA